MKDSASRMQKIYALKQYLNARQHAVQHNMKVQDRTPGKPGLVGQLNRRHK